MIRLNIKKGVYTAICLSAFATTLSSCHCEHMDEPTMPFKIGQVLCTDGSVISLCDFRTSTKEPVGIIFHVNDSPEDDVLGYAVYIHETDKVEFATECGTVQNTSASLADRDGNENTYAIYSTTGVDSPMANLVFDLWTYGQSAYIPSVAELQLLYRNRDYVNQRILAVGGEPLRSDSENCWLWSSTEVSGQEADKAWLFSMNYGDIQETPKNQPHQIRPVIAIRK